MRLQLHLSLFAVKIKTFGCIAVNLENLNPPVMEGLDSLIAVSVLFYLSILLVSESSSFP